VKALSGIQCTLYVASILIFPLLLACDSKIASENQNDSKGPITLVIHGGAGTIRNENMSEERRKRTKRPLGRLLTRVMRFLESGGTVLMLLIVSIRPIGHSRLFNAGKGAVSTMLGKII
jgi:beta-aspartyl-peptidase (threonine type)